MPTDREWQKNGIQKILKNALHMLRVSLVSPRIIENPGVALQCLKESKYIHFLHLFEDYINEKNINTAEMSSELYNNLLKIIEFFYADVQLLEYIKDSCANLKPLDKSLVDAFQLLKKITDKRLKKSAISELNKQKKNHELSQENKKTKRNIKVLQDVLKRKSLCAKWKQAAEEVLIRNYEKDLAHCTCESNLKIKGKIVSSTYSIRQIHLSSVTKQNELKGELHRIGKIYQNLLRENLAQEKSVQNERNKLLFQLESLVKKFDQTIGDQTKEHMDLQDEFNKQKEMFDTFLIAYYEQEVEYEQIVHLRKEEEKHHHEQRILLFMMNRSARVIQKHWRKFRRAQKKAAKKSKGREKSKKK